MAENQTPRPVDIEILHVAECPNRDVAAALLERVLSRLGLDPHGFGTRCVTEAEPGFHGSPSFLVDGIDVFAHPDESGELACRIYETSDGRSGTPAFDALYEAVREAIGMETGPTDT